MPPRVTSVTARGVNLSVFYKPCYCAWPTAAGSLALSRGWVGKVCIALVLIVCVAGCGLQPTSLNSDVLVSVINVTDYEIDVVISAILGDEVDTVERTVAPASAPMPAIPP